MVLVGRISVFLLILVLCACGQDKKIEKRATQLCACYQPLVEVSAELENAQMDSTGALQFSKRFEAARDQVEACVQAFQQKYEDLEKDKDRKALMEALKKECPEVFDLMERS